MRPGLGCHPQPPGLAVSGWFWQPAVGTTPRAGLAVVQPGAGLPVGFSGLPTGLSPATKHQPVQRSPALMAADPATSAVRAAQMASNQLSGPFPAMAFSNMSFTQMQSL